MFELSSAGRKDGRMLAYEVVGQSRSREPCQTVLTDEPTAGAKLSGATAADSFGRGQADAVVIMQESDRAT